MVSTPAKAHSARDATVRRIKERAGPVREHAKAAVADSRLLELD